jgi:metal-dependent amidase/aminoacylase/carboxypeptidase family protein
MMKTIERIKALAEEGKEQCITWRRYLHAHPELSFHEIETSSYIARQLHLLGFDNVTTIGDTGVFVTLEGKEKGRIILLRADIDALHRKLTKAGKPIQANRVAAVSSKMSVAVVVATAEKLAV